MHASTAEQGQESSRSLTPRALVWLAVCASAACATPQEDLGQSLPSADGGGGSAAHPDAALQEEAGAAAWEGGADVQVEASAGDADAPSAPDAAVDAGNDATPCVPPTKESTCGTSPQCGCPAGNKCDVVNFKTGQALCVVDNGTTQAYAQCQTSADCAQGTACVRELCRPYCTTDADCPGSARTCNSVETPSESSGPSQPVPGMKVCTAGCDPVAPCASGVGCYFTSTAGPQTDCEVAGKIKWGAACNPSLQSKDCEPANACIEDFGSYFCAHFCRKGLNDCPGQAGYWKCTSLPGNPTINGITYGACLPAF